MGPLTTASHRGLRAQLRRAVWQLPAAAQLQVKGTLGRLRGDDWGRELAALRHRERDEIARVVETSKRLPNRRRIRLFTLQTMPPWSAIDGGLATALRLRGHDVGGVICDGLMPVCELNLGRQERPPCAVCEGWAARHYEDAFGFEWPRLTAFLSDRDRVAARSLVLHVPRDARADLVVAGVTVGRFARSELQRFSRGVVDQPAADPAFEDWLVAGVLGLWLVERWLDREQPEIVGVSNGRRLLAAIVCAVARRRGLHVVTWDTEPTFADGLVFSHDRPAVEVSLDEAWTDAAAAPLPRTEADRLRTFLDAWALSANTPFPYNPVPVTDREVIAGELRLRPGAPLVVAFTNAVWDMAVVDRDVGFAGMFDWLAALVEFARRHPEVDLVIRAHPAETNVPEDLRTRTPVPAELRRRHPGLPGNVKIVEGQSSFSSYTLAEMSSVSTLYTSRLGLELAIRGRRPWIAGDVNYRGKGFTRDLAGASDMHAALEAALSRGEPPLTAYQVQNAERFAHLWFFRAVTRLPVLRPADGRVRLPSFLALAPGANVGLDRLCEAWTRGTPFIDLHG